VISLLRKIMNNQSNIREDDIVSCKLASQLKSLPARKYLDLDGLFFVCS